MEFYFESLDAFLHMDGHGVYVWVCYLITWGVLLYLWLSPGIRRKRWLRHQAALQRRHARNGDSGGAQAPHS